MTIDSRVLCQRSVPVGTGAGYAYGMVHASSWGERIPSSTSLTVRTDGRPVANLGIGSNGAQHPPTGQRTGEANWQTSGWRVVCKDAYCLPIPRLLFPRLSEMLRRNWNELGERQDNDWTSGQHETSHGVPSTICRRCRNVGMLVEREMDRIGHQAIPWRWISTPFVAKNDSAWNSSSSGRWHTLRYGGVWCLRPGRTARSFCRDGTRNDVRPFMRDYAE